MIIEGKEIKWKVKFLFFCVRSHIKGLITQSCFSGYVQNKLHYMDLEMKQALSSLSNLTKWQ